MCAELPGNRCFLVRQLKYKQHPMKTKNLLMKNLLTLTILLIMSVSSFARTYSSYTANKSGYWKALSTWTIVNRNDGIQKDKFIIPAGITIVADDDVNKMGLDNVELQISGVLQLAPSAILYFGAESKIDIYASGSIAGNGASQRIFIGGVSKYTGNTDKNLSGPLYADASTTGFTSYALMSVNFISFAGSMNNDNTISLKWSVSNEVNNKHYEVEARNSSEWAKIGLVAANANAASTNSYKFNTKDAKAGTTAFRLKQVDLDGTVHYSNIITINNKQALAQTKIFAANRKVNIQLPGEVKQTVAVKVMNLNGFVVASQSFNQPASNLSLSLNHLNAGTYVVYVSDNINMPVATKVMVN
jgi:hypothetical protein